MHRPKIKFLKGNKQRSSNNGLSSQQVMDQLEALRQDIELQFQEEMQALDVRLTKATGDLRKDHDFQIVRMKETLLTLSSKTKKLFDWKHGHLKDFDKVKRRGDFIF